MSATFYAVFDDGSVSVIETSAGAEPVLPRPGRLVDEETYRAQYTKLRAEHDGLVAELQRGDQARQLGDFEALTMAGIPEATARRLSGYAKTPAG